MQAIGNFNDFFHSIYRYREYLKQSVSRDLKKKYKRSVLGYVWSMLQPLLMMSILAVVFSEIMGTRTGDYSVFIFCGMLPWQYFSSTVNGSLHSISNNVKIISQVPVPKYLFSLSNAVSGFANFFLSLIPLLLIMLAIGHPLHMTMFALPLVLLPLFIVTMGVSLIVSASNVFFEDTQHLTGIVLQAAYFLSPILYARDRLPDWLEQYIGINPMVGVIESMRLIVYEGALPSFEDYMLNLFGCCIVLVIGLFIFKKSDDKFIYFI